VFDVGDLCLAGAGEDVDNVLLHSRKPPKRRVGLGRRGH